MSRKPKDGGSTWVDPDDAPELTEEWFARADIYDKGRLVRRGRPATGQAKQMISIRLDRDVVARLRALGPGWQTRVNAALRHLVDEGEAGHPNT